MKRKSCHMRDAMRRAGVTYGKLASDTGYPVQSLRALACGNFTNRKARGGARSGFFANPARHERDRRNRG
jgi:hypothetical protein